MVSCGAACLCGVSDKFDRSCFTKMEHWFEPVFFFIWQFMEKYLAYYFESPYNKRQERECTEEAAYVQNSGKQSHSSKKTK